MSAFTDFIQLELPKRPYLENDVPTNSIIVRNGAGPRQLEGIKLLPGQIIMNIAGTIQAVNLEDVSGNTDNHLHQQESASASWVITHGGGSENIIVNLYDENGKSFVPDDIEVTDTNTVTVTLSQPAIGKAVVLYF